MRTRVFELLKLIENGPLTREAVVKAMGAYAKSGSEGWVYKEAVDCGDAIWKEDGLLYITDQGRRALAVERGKGKR